MKKIFYTMLICLLFSSQCFCFELLGSGVVGAGGCSGDYGDNTTASSLVNSRAGYLIATRIPLSCGGTITAINAYMTYCGIDTNEIEFGLYADDGSGTDPAALIGSYGPFYDSGTAGGTVKWVTDTISQAVSSADYIWVVVMIEATITRQYYDAGTIQNRVYAGTWGVWPANWPTGSDSVETRDYGFYITF